MPRSFTFPVWLQGTPAEAEAEATRQSLLAASFTRAKSSEAELLIGRGALLEQTARQNLEQSFGVKGKEEERLLAKAQIAEALAMQGKYREAAEVHPDPQRRAEFRAIGRAIEKSDDEKCKCPDTRAELYQDKDGKLRARELSEGEGATDGGAVISATPRVELKKIFSPVHGDAVSLVECSKCGDLNARPLKSRLLKHRAANAQSERARGAVLSDAQVLGEG